MTEDWSSVAEALRERLDERGMNPTTLSRRSGVSLTTVRELLQNTNARKRFPRTMNALSAALGWPPDHLHNVLRHETDEQIRGMREQLDELRERLDVMERRDPAVSELNELHDSITRRLDELAETESEPSGNGEHGGNGNGHGSVEQRDAQQPGPEQPELPGAEQATR